MTDSLDSLTPEQKAEKLASLQKYAIKSDRTNVSDIPRWVKVAIARKEVLGLTWAECLEDIDRSPSTLDKWLTAPAAKTFRSQLSSIVNDPVELGAMILRADVANMAIDYLGAIEAAKRAGDYKEVRLGLRDILKTHNLIKDSDIRRTGGGMTINVTLSNPTMLTAPEVSSSYSVLEAEIVDD